MVLFAEESGELLSDFCLRRIKGGPPKCRGWFHKRNCCSEKWGLQYQFPWKLRCRCCLLFVQAYLRVLYHSVAAGPVPSFRIRYQNIHRSCGNLQRQVLLPDEGFTGSSLRRNIAIICSDSSGACVDAGNNHKKHSSGHRRWLWKKRSKQ